MFDEFAAGGTYPRPEDVKRLERYEQARRLFDGEHADSESAKRIADKLAESAGWTQWRGYTAEGVVWLVYNLPRLIVTKFADLQVLNTPVVQVPEQDAAEAAFADRQREDVPDLWARIHYAMQLKRAYGDCPVVVSRDEDGSVDLRACDPVKWFPVLNDGDPMRVDSHQIAWVEDHDEGKMTVQYLRVDVCYPDRVERRAFLLDSESDDPSKLRKIRAQVDLASHWDGLDEIDEAELGGLMSCVVLHNGCIKPGEIFGRPEFLDSGALVDDINWRLATWSDANDRLAHPTEIVPTEWIEQDEDGTARMPSQYRRQHVARGSRVADGPIPQYQVMPMGDYESLKDQFEQSIMALLSRHEMAPALLGIQQGRERESGEAKSLGMGTTEAATRRDLLQTQPQIERALTVLARLAELGPDVKVATHWRVGLPKTQAELMAELTTLKAAGLVTREDMLKALHPYMSDEQIAAKIEELDAERQADVDAFTQEFEAQQG